ncbi:hypothetical protein [Arthrospiribacter ruber]|uniref:Outer membrane protein beta-barrel domain-containing protein n=1 Tax=Arthrospiribacter ruber TaxID=2487934 RepID=A0A951IX01_9BACT|nr:hypothetical protein [Arthrospiribacter ruber]MBW3467078.1 hypothetical protein [Arthrospiribacter ruber]
MKNVIFCFFFMGLTSFVTAQQNQVVENVPFSIRPEFTLELGLPVFHGNNLLSNDYNLNPSVRMGFQTGIAERFGLGLFFSNNGGEVGQTRILGDFFDRVKWQVFGAHVFYAIPISEKLVFEPGLGFALPTMVHFDGEQKFRLNYHNFFHRSRISYVFYQIENRNALRIFVSGDYNLVRGPRININEEDRSYVRKGAFSNFGVGFGYSF